MRAVWFVALFMLCLATMVDAKPRYTAASSSEEHAAQQQQQQEISHSSQAMTEKDVTDMIDGEQRKHERRLKELQTRLERELQQLQEHFDSIMVKLKKTEEQLEQNLKNVESSVTKKMASSQQAIQTSSSSWRFPFVILILLLIGLGGFFGRLYHKATKGMRML